MINSSFRFDSNCIKESGNIKIGEITNYDKNNPSIILMFSKLELGLIDVYYMKSISIPPSLVMLKEILSDEELQTYHYYQSDSKRKEFWTGRWFLKSVLAYTIGVNPREILFKKNDYGKPYLKPNLQNKSGNKIYFNLSHSGGYVICAITLDYEIGIDIEGVDKDILEIAKRLYTKNEWQSLLSCDEKQRNAMSCQIWTLKEAYIKAKGKGLSISPKSFDVFQAKDMFFKTFQLEPELFVSLACENPFKIRKTCIKFE